MKKRFLAISLALALCMGLAVPAFATEDTPKPVATVKGEVLGIDDDSTALMVETGGRYTPYSTEGKKLGTDSYKYAKSYKNGMAAVTNEGAMKVIFDWEWDAEEQKEYGSDGKIREFEDGKYGYVDETGKLAIPMKYAKAFDFSEDRAFVRETLDGPLMMIDKTGKTIATYNNVSLWYYETVHFSEGLAIIPLQGDEEDSFQAEKYLVVDKDGKTVYTQEGGWLDFANGYHDGLVATAEDGFWGTGGPCLERGFNDMMGAGYKDKTGKKAISGDFDSVGAFKDGLAVVGKYDEEWNWKCGVIDASGKVVVPLKYDGYWDPRGGYAAVGNINGEDMLGAVVDKTGKFITGFNYVGIWGFKDGLCPVREKNSSIKVIDTDGKTVFTTQKADIGTRYSNGICCVIDSTTNKAVAYDKQGNALISTTASQVNIVDPGYIWFENQGSNSVYRIADLTGGSEPEPEAPVFTDVEKGDWYAAPVAWAVEGSITNGTDDTHFSPSKNCSQKEILTFLYRADRGEGPASGDDMDLAVAWAKEKGIIGDDFDGDKACTRATAVSYIWQAFGKKEAEKSSFTDVDANADYADAVSWAVANGITNGDGSDDVFSPDKVCSRGHIVTFLHRAYVEEARLPVAK